METGKKGLEKRFDEKKIVFLLKIPASLPLYCYYSLRQAEIDCKDVETVMMEEVYTFIHIYTAKIK